MGESIIRRTTSSSLLEESRRRRASSTDSYGRRGSLWAWRTTPSPALSTARAGLSASCRMSQARRLSERARAARDRGLAQFCSRRPTWDLRRRAQAHESKWHRDLRRRLETPGSTQSLAGVGGSPVRGRPEDSRWSARLEPSVADARIAREHVPGRLVQAVFKSDPNGGITAQAARSVRLSSSLSSRHGSGAKTLHSVALRRGAFLQSTGAMRVARSLAVDLSAGVCPLDHG
jgi:hypothetical protein